MPKVARKPQRAEWKTVCRKRDSLIRSTELLAAWERVQKNSRTGVSFLKYITTARDALST